jgi:hypothetical protein
MFREFRSCPPLARAEIELGHVLDDRSLATAGLAELEALGDLAHLGRVAAATTRRGQSRSPCAGRLDIDDRIG